MGKLKNSEIKQIKMRNLKMNVKSKIDEKAIKNRCEVPTKRTKKIQKCE